MSNFWTKIFLTTLLFVLLVNTSSYAYIGLGPLVPILGSLVMYIFIGLITFLGLILYPLRLLKKKIKKKNKNLKQ
tara:strand:- start:141 stop:365 length:225 start_codon:yes stop_codon:yes gene_type:complete